MRERVPRRRRQSASADPVRRQQARRQGDAPIAFGDRILDLCIEVGGTITGEHGVGIEKLVRHVHAIRRRPSSRAFSAIKAAFDAGRPAQSGQGRADARALRGIRPHARARRPIAASGLAALLKDHRAMNASPSSRAATRARGRRGRRATRLRATTASARDRDVERSASSMATAKVSRIRALPDVVVFPHIERGGGARSSA